MRSTFFGLEIGYRGLATHQKALDITGHNIANASTPGYSRQRGEITETIRLLIRHLTKQMPQGRLVLELMLLRFYG